MMARAFKSFETARQVIIGSVHGQAVAGGFGLALAADIPW
jgi:enoyl-CoA hydratase/carnithine racemase